LAKENSASSVSLHTKRDYNSSMDSNISTEEQKIKKPNWLRVKLPIGEEYKHVRNLVDTHKLHNIYDSW